MFYNNPYMSQYQIPSTPTLSGRIVNNCNEIMANDVPMDGQCGIFPTSDFQSIYVKKWNANGTITTVEYKPQIAPKSPQIDNLPSDDKNNEYGQIRAQLEDIRKILEGRYEHTANNKQNDESTPEKSSK